MMGFTYQFELFTDLTEQVNMDYGLWPSMNPTVYMRKLPRSKKNRAQNG